MENYIFPNSIESLLFFICLWSWKFIPNWYLTKNQFHSISYKTGEICIQKLFLISQDSNIEKQNCAFFKNFIENYLNPNVPNYILTDLWRGISDFFKKKYKSQKKFRYQKNITLFVVILLFIPNLDHTCDAAANPESLHGQRRVCLPPATSSR